MLFPPEILLGFAYGFVIGALLAKKEGDESFFRDSEKDLQMFIKYTILRSKTRAIISHSILE